LQIAVQRRKLRPQRNHGLQAAIELAGSNRLKSQETTVTLAPVLATQGCVDKLLKGFFLNTDFRKRKNDALVKSMGEAIY
jgi:hypothetical protein